MQAILLFVVADVALANNVLVIGDSMGEYSGAALSKFCKGAVVKNAAVGGTTAVQWTSGGLMDSIGSAKCGGTPDAVWLSVGGNDFLNTECSGSVSDMAAKITASINAVKQKVPGAKILMTGYCMPATAESASSACNSPAKFTALGSAVKQAAEADAAVTFVDSTAACGGTSSSWSPVAKFQDPIHLNNKGYCSVFTQKGVQDALGCQSATYDCEAEKCMVEGFDLHCAPESRTLESCPNCCNVVDKGDGIASAAVTPVLSMSVLFLLLTVFLR
eukprot:TRINITY_DN27710_c0_g1_i1.p1 TRINITY_DN27710_c0_g1~~TRINITY_DN27710_c0_g1_i1.p1  ORF type:complete len:294 (-),score=70.05 TRINITY_DN27710_c0_g1_i1:267-1088(-)